MIYFEERSTALELMDDPTISQERLHQALDDISYVNKTLGGTSISINAVNACIKANPDKTEWTILDVGCGDGEMLRLLKQKLPSSLKLKLIGVDLNERCIARAKEKSHAFPNIQYEKLDIFTITPDQAYCDILLCTLTLHHIKEAQLINFIAQCKAITAKALIINDLQRSRLAYGLFKLFSLAFFIGDIASYDGLISIKSGFLKSELKHYAQVLNLKNYTVKWKWAFRYLWYIDTQ